MTASHKAQPHFVSLLVSPPDLDEHGHSGFIVRRRGAVVSLDSILVHRVRPRTGSHANSLCDD